MLLVNQCFCASRSTSLILNINKFRKVKGVPRRLFFKWDSVKTADPNRINKYKEYELEGVRGIDDENFSEYLKKALLDPQAQKKGFLNLMSECKRFYTEEIGSRKFSDIGNFEIPDERTKVRILHKFETEEDLNGCSVLTDSTYNIGFSSASFKLTANETAVFSGNICTDIPKTGDIGFSGYANLHCPKQRRAFYRLKPYDWTNYTHLVFKIRGDGRTYVVLLHMPSKYDETQYFQYCLPLYTRGGPYWQIAKLPFSYFYLVRKGEVHNLQKADIPLDKILYLSLTVGAYEGPFKLEIDYIGLENKEFHKKTCPYEMYK